jgi:4-alpha-glucanotransferase
MSERDDLEERARAAGIATSFENAMGHQVVVGSEALEALLDSLGRRAARVPSLAGERSDGESDPGWSEAWLPDSILHGHGVSGIAIQLYLLRSAQNWGFGDFEDLRQFVGWAGARGCDIVGLNPLHMMFLDDPEHASPYAPASRLLMNVLYIAVPTIPGFADCEAAQELVASADFQARLAECRATPFVDYSAVEALKLPVLRLLHGQFLQQGDKEQAAALSAYRREIGPDLERSCLFQALRSHFGAENPSWRDWRNWPEDLRDARAAGVPEYAKRFAGEVEFLVWMQWIADQQFALAAKAAVDAGMEIGLYRDLAVGCDQAGAEPWVAPLDYVDGVTVGAPPDVFNPAGQNWGIAPLHPAALKQEHYRSFRALLRANMRHAGALRIDHAMGLQRLYCIPSERPERGGSYINYPLADMLGVIAEESRALTCLVIAEDLGTVPAGFSATIAAAKLLSYRVLFFEQDIHTGRFHEPEAYPHLAMAVAANHDLPTLEAWWAGDDLHLKQDLGQFPTDNDRDWQWRRREQDQRSVLEAFKNRPGITLPIENSDAFAKAAHSLLWQTHSAIVMLQLDDLIGETKPVNVPGTDRQYPNWRRKYGLSLEALFHGERPLVLEPAGLPTGFRAAWRV